MNLVEGMARQRDKGAKSLAPISTNEESSSDDTFPSQGHRANRGTLAETRHSGNLLSMVQAVMRSKKRSTKLPYWGSSPSEQTIKDFRYSPRFGPLALIMEMFAHETFEHLESCTY